MERGKIMAVRSKEEMIASLSELLKDDNSDEAIQAIEDLSDTLEAKDSEDWETRYKENDKMWREKYKARFLSTENEDEEDAVEETEKISYEDLFEKGEK